LQLNSESVDLFVKEFGAYGLWGLALLLFLIFGMPQMAPIITAVGTVYNDRHKANLSHQRSMAKLKNKRDQDLVGKLKGK
jgi:hypothetical protein